MLGPRNQTTRRRHLWLGGAGRGREVYVRLASVITASSTRDGVFQRRRGTLIHHVAAQDYACGWGTGTGRMQPMHIAYDTAIATLTWLFGIAGEGTLCVQLPGRPLRSKVRRACPIGWRGPHMHLAGLRTDRVVYLLQPFGQAPGPGLQGWQAAAPAGQGRSSRGRRCSPRICPRPPAAQAAEGGVRGHQQPAAWPGVPGLCGE